MRLSLFCIEFLDANVDLRHMCAILRYDKPSATAWDLPADS